MANKTKKITANVFKKAVNDNYSSTATVEWNGLNVVIKRNLSLEEMTLFVNSVVDACVSDGEIHYELAEFAFAAIAIELYTNIDTPSDISEKYDLIYKSKIMDLITHNIDMDQYANIHASVYSKLNYIRDVNTSVINKQISELYGMIENIESQMASIFSGVNSEDIKNVIGALSNGKIDEEKLMSAYIENKK